MTAYELDHLAIATETWDAAGALLTEKFGAIYEHGAILPVFSPCQFSFGGDMRIELLEPESISDSFLYRFLKQNDGNSAPHHVTFKVADIEKSIARARELGLEPIQIRIDNESWREAFLHPRDTELGILVQFVETSGPLGGDGPHLVASRWGEPNRAAVNLPYLVGTVQTWAKPMLVLRDVLGAVVMELSNDVRVFGWEQGAQIVLSHNPTVAAGIDAIGVSEPGDDHDDVRQWLGAVTTAPVVTELGISVIELSKERAAG